MSLYFRPEKAVLGDVIPYYDNGVFKPFYLRNYRANRDEQHQDSWVMLSTTDHIHYTEHDTKIVGGTGSVIKVDGLYLTIIICSPTAIIACRVLTAHETIAKQTITKFLQTMSTMSSITGEKQILVTEET